MKKIITGFIFAIPLAMTILPSPASASALQVIVRPQVRPQVRSQVRPQVRPQVQNQRPAQFIKAQRKVWVPGYWVKQGKRKVWIAGRYEWRR